MLPSELEESELSEDATLLTLSLILFIVFESIFSILTPNSLIKEYATALATISNAARRLKRRVLTPLNYNQHLKLKYKQSFTNLSDSLCELIFTGNPENAIKYEFETNKALTNIVEYTSSEWDYYLKYGGFPTVDEDKPLTDVREEIVTMTNKIITEDIMQIKTITSDNQAIGSSKTWRSKPA